MTTATDDTVKISCAVCWELFPIARGDLRGITDAGFPPRCPMCVRKRRMTPRTKAKVSTATVVEKMLWVAVRECPDRQVIGLTRLVIASWKRFSVFGLLGTEDRYPDSNRVNVAVVQAVQKGWLERVSTRTYRVTEVGMSVAQRYEE